MCFDVGKLPRDPRAKDIDDAVTWVQPLGTAKEKILLDYGRRMTAAHIAYGEGILVCPTNAGVLVGVDLLTHSLVWAHTYSDAPAAQPPSPDDPWGGIRKRPWPPLPGGQSLSSNWKASAPVVQDGKVVFALPDGPELRCLSLRDGRLLWSAKRGEEDVYLAGVFAGKVVVVSKKDVRGLGLDDGKELWRVPTGMPSGRGAASDNVYYLPLREAVFTDKEKGPGIAAIDVTKGKVVAQTRSKKDRDGKVEMPGNLIFFDGQVISQSATEVVAYPQLKVKLEQMDELLKKDPKDPKGLFERGELRLDKGDVLGAVEDFHAALANNPPEDLRLKLRAKLFDALTELLGQDFGAGEKYLKEYEGLCKVEPANNTGDARVEADAETRRRQFLLLSIKGRGYEGQGKAVDALNAYLALAGLKDVDALVPVSDETGVKARPDVWARGRIAALFAAAKPPSRKLLEDEIGKKWEAVRKGNDEDALRAFVALFAPTYPAGREAQLALAERLMAREGKADLLEAEVLLTKLSRQKDDAGSAAKAVEALARLMIRKGMLEDALHYYRILARDYPKTVIRDGKKGADFLDDLATDKRFLPYLDEPAAAPGNRKFKATEERDRNFPMQHQHTLYTFDAQNDALPFLKRHRVAINYQNNHFKLVDRRTGEGTWSEPLEGVNFQYTLQVMQNVNPNQASGRFGYQSVGHLVVVNFGQHVAAFDPVNHTILWKKNLLGAQGPGGGQLNLNPDGTLELVFPDATRLPIGQLGPVEATYVCLQTRDGLMALDPLTGKTLWTRSDVPTRCRLFGDDKHVYVVELDTNNVATSTRAFRATDGAAVAVANFAALYQKRLRVIGSELLVADKLPTGELYLRLYDVHSGKDLWSKTFAAGAVVLRSEEPDLAGAIAPDGKVTVVDLKARKEVLSVPVEPEHMKNVQQAHLLADGQNVYIAFHVQDPKNPGGIASNLQPYTGLRAITVSGRVYAFDRHTGKIRWHNDVENQQLVLEQWKDMPVLLFTSRFHPSLVPPGFPRNPGTQIIGIEAYNKHSGRVVYRTPTTDKTWMSVNQYGLIYAINNDVRNGKVEMIANNYKVTITAEDGKEP